MGSDGGELRLTLVPVTAAELPAWRDTWSELESQAERPKLSVSYDWLTAWVRVLQPSGLHLARAADEDDRTVALGLLTRDRVRNLLFAGGDLSPTRRPLCASGSAAATWAAFARWLDTHRHMWATFEASGVDDAIRPLAGAELETTHGTYLTLPASFDDHLATLSERDRNEVRRRLRRSAEAGVALQRVQGSDIDDALVDFLAFHRARATEAGITSAVDAQALELLRAATEGDAELDVVEVRKGDDRVAVGINVVHRGVMFPYAIGWEPSASSLAPGILLTIDTVVESLRRGLHAIDMGPGAQKYKRSLGFEVVPGYVARLANPSPVGRAYRMLSRLPAWRR